MLMDCFDPSTYDLDFDAFATRVVRPGNDDSLATFEVMRDRPSIEEWDYWMMPVDWFDAEDVTDYLESDVIFCDFMLNKLNDLVTQFTANYEEFPWFTWATYCSIGDSLSDP